jgi:hypothetical protein
MTGLAARVPLLAESGPLFRLSEERPDASRENMHAPAVRGRRPVSAAGRSDLVLRDVNTGAFQSYNIACNSLTGSPSLGAVGLDWQLGGLGATGELRRSLQLSTRPDNSQPDPTTLNPTRARSFKKRSCIFWLAKESLPSRSSIRMTGQSAGRIGAASASPLI